MFINFAKRILKKPYRYIFPLVVYRKQRIFRRKVKSRISRANLGQNENLDLESKLAVSIFIPVALKDIARLATTVNSLKKYLRHPIKEIIVCGMFKEPLVEVCAELGVKLIDERDIQPIAKGDISCICNGVDRSGWIYQQLLKLNASNCCESDHILIWDSDTEMLKPTSFENQGKLIIEYSEEIHRPYEVCTTKMLGQCIALDLGFTCHKILFSKVILRAMIKEIESRFGLPWYEAIINCIDADEASGFSEYNVYSNYALIGFSESVEIRHWRNLSDVKTSGRLRNVLIKKMFSTVSYHSWEQ